MDFLSTTAAVGKRVINSERWATSETSSWLNTEFRGSNPTVRFGWFFLVFVFYIFKAKIVYLWFIKIFVDINFSKMSKYRILGGRVIWVLNESVCHYCQLSVRKPFANSKSQFWDKSVENVAQIEIIRNIGRSHYVNVRNFLMYGVLSITNSKYQTCICTGNFQEFKVLNLKKFR